MHGGTLDIENEHTQTNRDMSDTTQMIIQEIQKRISRLKEGYKIVSKELDGCDEYGEKYWVECGRM